MGDTGQGFGGIVVNTGREPADDESSAIAAAAAVAEAAFYSALRCRPRASLSRPRAARDVFRD